MRIPFIVITIICLICSCAKKRNTTFSGKIKGLSKGTLYLQQIKDSSLVTIDSVSLNGSNQFSFNFDLAEPDVFLFHLDKKDGTVFNDRLTLFLSPGENSMKAQLKDFEKTAKITGSPNHEKLVEYNTMIQKFNIDDFKLAQLNNLAKKTGKQGFVDATVKDQISLLKRKYLYTVNFALKNKDLEIAPYIVITETPDANPQYLDTIYNSLPEHIKASKYGIQLEALRNKK